MKIKAFASLAPLPGFKGSVKPDTPLRFNVDKEEEVIPTDWYGTHIKSKPEWWAIKSLLRLKIDFDYQYAVWGGDQRPGGYTVDFLIKLPPRPFPFEIFGGYWHEGQKGAKDKIRETRLAAHFKVPKIQGLYEDDLATEEAVYAGMRRELL